MAERTTQEVFEDHLRLRVQWKLEEDLRRNYSPEVVLLCNFAVLRGRDAIRESARRLGLQLPEARIEYVTKQVADDYALLEWTADSERFMVKDGVDSFVIRNGSIVMQTIRYSLIQSTDPLGGE
jgi:hypothetical protein